MAREGGDREYSLTRWKSSTAIYRRREYEHSNSRWEFAWTCSIILAAEFCDYTYICNPYQSLVCIRVVSNSVQIYNDSSLNILAGGSFPPVSPYQFEEQAERFTLRDRLASLNSGYASLFINEFFVRDFIAVSA